MLLMQKKLQDGKKSTLDSTLNLVTAVSLIEGVALIKNNYSFVTKLLLQINQINLTFF